MDIKDIIQRTTVPSQYSDLWEKIPYETKELLWFTADKPKQSNHTGLHTIELSFNGNNFNVKYNDHVHNDPSTIYFVLPIQVPADISLVEKLPYMPSYIGMNPEQRYVYLTWLQDVSQTIDVGYKFVFYYGLERKLIIGDFEKAFNMIAMLRKTTQNNSFQAYSGNALFYSVMKSGNEEYLEKLRFFFDDDVWYDKQIMLKLFLQEPIEAHEIPKILKGCNVNKRYLGEKIYVEQMREILSEKYGRSFLTRGIMDDDREEKYINSDTPVFANYSFPDNFRVMKNVTHPVLDEPLSIIKELHFECHERTKKNIAKGKQKLPKK